MVPQLVQHLHDNGFLSLQCVLESNLDRAMVTKIIKSCPVKVKHFQRNLIWLALAKIVKADKNMDPPMAIADTMTLSQRSTVAAALVERSSVGVSSRTVVLSPRGATQRLNLYQEQQLWIHP